MGRVMRQTAGDWRCGLIGGLIGGLRAGAVSIVLGAVGVMGFSGGVGAQVSQASELPIAASGLTLVPSGKLRVSNRSEHPIRLAMRLKSEKLRGDKYNEKVSQRDRYEAPAHWDFYAGEGSDRGLVVALPNRSLHLSKGDVVIAFAQDGSRRYWGPFIVGETDNPLWDPATQEWKLVLED
jgi:hypothetical protein